MSDRLTELDVAIGADPGDFSPLLEALVADRVASRIFDHDTTLWGEAARAEAEIRLGWTDPFAAAESLLDEVEALRAELAGRGVDRIVLCGMGGSSLAPEVIARWSGVALTVIDSTHPAVMRRELSADLSRTAVVVSSKSGGTIETRSHRASFDHAFRETGIDPAGRIIVVTDPGSALEADAREAGQRVFLADPNVGGRFSALTAFGLVPTGLAGADVRRLLADASSVVARVAADSVENPALVLAAVLAAGLPDRYLLALSSGNSADWGLGAWVEQLIAESTGKDGTGVLPVALPVAAPELRDRPGNMELVHLYGETADPLYQDFSGSAAVTGTLGAHFMMWEVLTAALGKLMGIDPFDQPDVESAKVAAREALARTGAADSTEDPREDRTDGDAGRPVAGLAGVSLLASSGIGEDPSLESAAGVVAAVQAMVPENGYLAIQAYLDPAGQHAATLERLRGRLAERLRVPVTLGWGPRYLHSVGQLHKGGPALGAFLQVTDGAFPDVAIPGQASGFGDLITAQARGDRDVLAARGRPVLAIRCADPEAALREIVAAV
ncbi:glucose-6-phosphate isomerase [Leucobacter zeae]|nr:glucose-6-phosphate isomerase [Leucobacter zeae]